MHSLDSFLEKETQKLLCDFEIQIYLLISARKFDLEKKDDQLIIEFCRSRWPLGKTERKRKES